MRVDQLTETDVLRMLATIPEPCAIALGANTNIVSMGLIEAITIADDLVSIELCLTDPGCVHYQAIKRYIADTLQTLAGVTQTEVTITTDKLWSPDRIQSTEAPHVIVSQC
ncbi:MAG: metal-sulfur cluster biosynthetic enzyme [Halioglobus sp.]|jgi:metal-sulfur cluster biosynthetic enzyme